jgi:hypothetical protein
MRITQKYAGASCLGRRVHSVIGPSPPVLKPLGESRVDHFEQSLHVEEGHWEFHAYTSEYDDVDAAEPQPMSHS